MHSKRANRKWKKKSGRQTRREKRARTREQRDNARRRGKRQAAVTFYGSGSGTGTESQTKESRHAWVLCSFQSQSELRAQSVLSTVE